MLTQQDDMMDVFNELLQGDDFELSLSPVNPSESLEALIQLNDEELSNYFGPEVVTVY